MVTSGLEVHGTRGLEVHGTYRLCRSSAEFESFSRVVIVVQNVITEGLSGAARPDERKDTVTTPNNKATQTHSNAAHAKL